MESRTGQRILKKNNVPFFFAAVGGEEETNLRHPHIKMDPYLPIISLPSKNPLLLTAHHPAATHGPGQLGSLAVPGSSGRRHRST